MLLDSMNLQPALQDLQRAGASLLAAAGKEKRPIPCIVARLRKLPEAVLLDAPDQTIGPAQKRLYHDRELGFPTPDLLR